MALQTLTSFPELAALVVAVVLVVTFGVEEDLLDVPVTVVPVMVVGFFVVLVVVVVVVVVTCLPVVEVVICVAATV